MIFFYECCVGFTADVMGHTPSKNFNFCLITTVPSFLHLWIMALTVVRWIPKALSPVHTASDRATWSHSFSMESWPLPATRATVTVGDGMWACQATRVKRQKLRISQLYANEQPISRATTNRSEESVSGAHTSPSRVHVTLFYVSLF